MHFKINPISFFFPVQDNHLTQNYRYSCQAGLLLEPPSYWWQSSWIHSFSLSVSHQVLACKYFMRPLCRAAGAQRLFSAAFWKQSPISSACKQFSAWLKLNKGKGRRQDLFTPHIGHSSAKLKSGETGEKFMKQ